MIRSHWPGSSTTVLALVTIPLDYLPPGEGNFAFAEFHIAIEPEHGRERERSPHAPYRL